MGSVQGSYSRDIFDELKQYTRVTVQQSTIGKPKPIIDADLNDAFKIQQNHLRRALQSAFGDGRPAYRPDNSPNRGFKITSTPTPSVTNFVIQGGDSTPNGSGRVIVNGFQCLNPLDVEYEGTDPHIQDLIHHKNTKLTNYILYDDSASFFGRDLSNKKLVLLVWNGTDYTETEFVIAENGENWIKINSVPDHLLSAAVQGVSGDNVPEGGKPSLYYIKMDENPGGLRYEDVYLDVYEDEYDYVLDTDLNHNIGGSTVMQSMLRKKLCMRIWVEEQADVTGDDLPYYYTDANNNQHTVIKLARFFRNCNTNQNLEHSGDNWINQELGDGWGVRNMQDFVRTDTGSANNPSEPKAVHVLTFTDDGLSTLEQGDTLLCDSPPNQNSWVAEVIHDYRPTESKVAIKTNDSVEDGDVFYKQGDSPSYTVPKDKIGTISTDGIATQVPEPSNKVDVQAQLTDDDYTQLRVRDFTGEATFEVDNKGNTEILGNLRVHGDTEIGVAKSFQDNKFGRQYLDGGARDALTWFGDVVFGEVFDGVDAGSPGSHVSSSYTVNNDTIVFESAGAYDQAFNVRSKTINIGSTTATTDLIIGHSAANVVINGTVAYTGGISFQSDTGLEGPTINLGVTDADHDINIGSIHAGKTITTDIKGTTIEVEFDNIWRVHKGATNYLWISETDGVITAGTHIWPGQAGRNLGKTDLPFSNTYSTAVTSDEHTGWNKTIDGEVSTTITGYIDGEKCYALQILKSDDGQNKSVGYYGYNSNWDNALDRANLFGVEYARIGADSGAGSKWCTWDGLIFNVGGKFQVNGGPEFTNALIGATNDYYTAIYANKQRVCGYMYGDYWNQDHNNMLMSSNPAFQLAGYSGFDAGMYFLRDQDATAGNQKQATLISMGSHFDTASHPGYDYNPTNRSNVHLVFVYNDYTALTWDGSNWSGSPDAQRVATWNAWGSVDMTGYVDCAGVTCGSNSLNTSGLTAGSIWADYIYADGANNKIGNNIYPFAEIWGNQVFASGNFFRGTSSNYNWIVDASGNMGVYGYTVCHGYLATNSYFEYRGDVKPKAFADPTSYTIRLYRGGDISTLPANSLSQGAIFILSETLKYRTGANTYNVGTTFTGSHVYKSDILNPEEDHIGDFVSLSARKIDKSATEKDPLAIGCIAHIMEDDHATSFNEDRSEGEKTFQVAAVGDPRSENCEGVKLTNSNGDTQPGDLLCTSSVSGRLMKQPTFKLATKAAMSNILNAITGIDENSSALDLLNAIKTEADNDAHYEEEQLFTNYTVAKCYDDPSFDENGLADNVYATLHAG
jgi:hypothetical protein